MCTICPDGSHARRVHDKSIHEQNQQINKLWIMVSRHRSSLELVSCITACFRLWYDITSSLQIRLRLQNVLLDAQAGLRRLKSLLVWASRLMASNVHSTGTMKLLPVYRCILETLKKRYGYLFNLREVRFHSKHKTWCRLPAKVMTLLLCIMDVCFFCWICGLHTMCPFQKKIQT